MRRETGERMREYFFIFLKREKDRVLNYERLVHDIYQEYLKFEIENLPPLIADLKLSLLIQKKTFLFLVSMEI